MKLLLIGGVLFLMLYQICYKKKNMYEGLDVPDRIIDADLKDILKMGVTGLGLSSDYQKEQLSKLSSMEKKYNPKNNFGVEIARSNFRECGDSSNYHGCNIDTPSPKQLDPRYIHLPSKQIDNSDMYTHVSMCPMKYQNNMIILKNKQSIGQYSGYTPNEYIDKIRYVKTKEPLPVNPDFFVKDGGTY